MSGTHTTVFGVFAKENAVDQPKGANRAGLLFAIGDGKVPRLFIMNKRFTDRARLAKGERDVGASKRITTSSWSEISVQRWLLDQSVVLLDGTVIKDHSVFDDTDADAEPELSQLSRVPHGWSLT